METLNDTTWDVVISGTGLPQSLLALALSRSGKKVLHVDRNEYYGGDEAALGLVEAEAWAQRHSTKEVDATTTFSHASVITASNSEGAAQAKLSSNRAYSLALAPQMLYTRSTLLPALVSSKTHNQLEFQAVGSWFIASTHQDDTSPPKLTRVPGGREDIFQDNTLDLKAKRSLMKFLRFVTNHEEQIDTWQHERSKPFSSFLQERFNLPLNAHAPLIALTLSAQPTESTTVEFAVPQIAKYLTSIGVFGPGFGAVLPKWGGLAEISQVACRASAVGGGVYVLGRGVIDVQHDDEFNLRLQLSDGENVTTKWLAGVQSELPGFPTASEQRTNSVVTTCHSISLVSSPLQSLFPPTSEGGVTPAGAVILIPAVDVRDPPVHIFAHSSEAGECPATQCVLYASVAQDNTIGFGRLERAVSDLLSSIGEEQSPSVLWHLQYQQQYPSASSTPRRAGPVIILQSLSPALALEDTVLEDIKAAWEQITHDDPASFMKFEAREGTAEDEE